MKNKLNRISLIISYLIAVLILLIALLGLPLRKGYLSEFQLVSSKNGQYTYTGRIKYHTKVFRNNDIYGVYQVHKQLFMRKNKYIKKIIKEEKDSPFLSLISSKKLEFEDKINDVKYILKLKSPFWLIFITAIAFIIIKSRKQIQDLYNKFFVDNYYLDSNSIEIDKIISLNKLFKINNIKNLMFILIVFILSAFTISIAIFDTIKGDDWDYLMIRTEQLFQIYDFSNLIEGRFWERGRHYGDIIISVGGYLANIIKAFGVNPFTSLKISTSLLSLLSMLIFALVFSIAYYLFNKNKYYKLFFISIYLYLIFMAVTPSKNLYYTNIVAYIGCIGLSFFIFLPIIYYFLYEKEILLFNNRYIHYGFYTFLVYFIAFNFEVSSLFISGIAFFMFIYIVLDTYKNSKKLNPYILYILLSIMILSAFAVYCTSLSRRGQYNVDKVNIVDNFQYFFNQLFLFEKIILFIGIIYIIYYIIILLKNKAINKFDYMIFSFLVTSVLGIIGFFVIYVERIYPFQVILLLCIIAVISKYLSKKNILSFFATIIIVLFFANLSIKTMYDYTVLVKSPQFDKILYDLFVEADRNNLKEIIVKDKDLINKLRYEERYKLNISKLSPDKMSAFNRCISTTMYNYGITKKYIPISVEN